jgi:hypothetical protein
MAYGERNKVRDKEEQRELVEMGALYHGMGCELKAVEEEI